MHLSYKEKTHVLPGNTTHTIDVTSELDSPMNKGDKRDSMLSTTSITSIHDETDPVLIAIFKYLDEDEREVINTGSLLDLLASVGFSNTDPRLAKMIRRLQEIGGYRKDIEISFDIFKKVTHGNVILLNKAMKQDLTVPDWQEFCGEIRAIYDEVKEIDGGDIATYIPALALQDPSLFCISCCTIDGQIYSVGDKDYQYCVQSCCKPIAYLIAAQEKGFDYVHNHVGREPSGASFNNLSLKESPTPENSSRRIPHNPMINSGAIMSCAIIKRQESMAVRFAHVMKTWGNLCASRVAFSNSVYLSEKDTADRNWCLGYMMQEYESFPKGTNLQDSLEFYFQQCSIEANTEQMSILAGTLANGGINPLSGERIFDAFHVRNCLSLMLSSGMYDYSGEWGFSVGLPAKSGVAGCIWCVVPNKMGFAVFSPKLDSHGNSHKGVSSFLKLTEKFNFHQYDSLKGVLAGGLHVKKDPTMRKKQLQTDHITNLLFAAVEGDLNEVIGLHSAGANVWDGDYDQRTTLHLAACEGHLRIVKWLINLAKQEGATEHLSPCDRWGRTPLDDAVTNNHPKIVEALRKAGAHKGQDLKN